MLNQARKTKAAHKPAPVLTMSTSLKLSGVAASLLVLSFLVTPNVDTGTLGCLPSFNEAVENVDLQSGLCQQNEAEFSWVAWVMNKTTSNQFHFLDLLELLSSNKTD
jgi:hypothetical protein